MYRGVPMHHTRAGEVLPLAVEFAVSGRASPKSSSFTPWAVRKTFDGLRSRWITPRACSADSAASISSATGTASGTLNGAAPQALREDLALEQLHRDEELAAVLSNLVDLADVGMVHARRGAGLAPEPAPRRLVAARRGHRLQRDRTLEPLVARGIDDTHASLAELGPDRVVADAVRQRRARSIVTRAADGSGDGAPVSQSLTARCRSAGVRWTG